MKMINFEKPVSEARKKHDEKEALAKHKLEALCKTNAFERYGERIPAQVAKRLKSELKPISENGFCRLYLLAHKVAHECRERSIPVLAQGCAGASLVAFLLGITQTNPLPHHLYCPRCGYFEKRDRSRIGKPGYQLIAKSHCPRCEEKLERDGHDIPFESFAGFNGEKTPSFELAVPAEVREGLDKYPAELLSNDDVLCADEYDTPEYKSSVRLFGVSFLSMLNKLQYLTNVSEGAISVDDAPYGKAFEDELYRDIPGLDEITPEIVKNVFIKDLPEFVKALGFARGRGAWNESVESVLKQSRLAVFNSIEQGTDVVDTFLRHKALLFKTISHREDLMQTFMKYDFEKERAFNIMEAVRKGGAETVLNEELVSEMRDNGVDDALVEVLRKIEYLSSRACDTELAIKLSKLLWYRVNFPEEYAAAAR